LRKAGRVAGPALRGHVEEDAAIELHLVPPALRVYVRGMTEDDLEVIIADLVRRKKHARPAEEAMLNRVLNGLRYKYEEAGGIWEDLDPFGWTANPP
jgi:hypothetical protein